MMRLVAVAALLAVTALMPTAAPICKAGPSLADWSGSPAELAGLEAVYQAEYARQSGQAYTRGAPVASPWSTKVVCTV